MKGFVMAQDGVRYLQQLLRQASREVDRDKLDRLTAEIFRVVATREQLRRRVPAGRKSRRGKGR
jgi:hypothetical protein